MLNLLDLPKDIINYIHMCKIQSIIDENNNKYEILIDDYILENIDFQEILEKLFLDDNGIDLEDIKETLPTNFKRFKKLMKKIQDENIYDIKDNEIIYELYTYDCEINRLQDLMIISYQEFEKELSDEVKYLVKNIYYEELYNFLKNYQNKIYLFINGDYNIENRENDFMEKMESIIEYIIENILPNSLLSYSIPEKTDISHIINKFKKFISKQ